VRAAIITIIETTLMTGSGAPARTRSVQVQLPANVWVVIPQWFEGTARSVSVDAFARKVFIGTDDRGREVRFVIEFPLENIPPR
jgi:hypothetical protein